MIMIGGVLMILLAAGAQPTVVLSLPAQVPAPVQYAAEQIQAQWQPLGLEVKVTHSRPPRGAAAVVVSILGEAKSNEWTRRYGLRIPQEPESYALQQLGSGGAQVLVVGRDAVGAMRGMLELADLLPARTAALLHATGRASKARSNPELVAQTAADAFSSLTRVSKTMKPRVAFRATNPFLSLPFPPDQPWWLLSEEFWTKYLDMLAHARFNWVDIHGMYNVMRTNFPNIYPYFVNSKTFPHVGVPDAEKARNLAMLKKVVAMAKRRGIKIALMSYHASWNVPGGQKVPYPQTEENLALYTRECVEALLKAVPDLGMIGFRIGESGRRENFYELSYLPGLADSGLKLPLYTRSWGASHSAIRDLGNRYPGRFFLEIKYNGEHYGLPYIVAGGRMARWRDYSYQGYASYPRPFTILWQIRANGTHRFFRWAEPDFVKTTARCCALCGARGFSLESIETYFPQMDYFHRPDCGHKYPYWVMDRYWLWYLVWGWLTYSPGDTGWQEIACLRLADGDVNAASAMLQRIKSASRIVPLIYAAHCMGPDHRNMAPEFETGGNILEFGNVEPLDPFVYQSTGGYVTHVLSGRPDARITPLKVAQELDDLAAAATRPVPGAPASDEWVCWTEDNAALAHLARYYAHKIRAAVALRMFEQTGDEGQAAEARRQVRAAAEAWGNLSKVTARHYEYVHDTLRMHDPHFLWSKLLPGLQRDIERLDQRLDQVRQEQTELLPLLRHVPVRLLRRGEDLRLEATVAGRERPKLVAKVELKPGQWTAFAARPLGHGRAVAVVPAERLPRPRVRYFLEATVAGKTVRYPQGAPDRSAILVPICLDGPPRFVKPAEAKEIERTPELVTLQISALVADADGIAKAWVWYKPLPSTRVWRRRPARVSHAGRRWRVWATVPSTPEGVMWAVEVADAAGQASRSPSFDINAPDIPYRWLDPWPGPVTRGQSLKALPRKLLTRERFSAMLLGRGATDFYFAPPEVKQRVLDAVREGLNLVICDQDCPDKFSLDWLPGGIKGGDKDVNEVKVVPGHPLTRGLGDRLRSDKIGNDLFDDVGQGWQILTDPPALAVRREGKGYIILCQLRVLERFNVLGCQRVVENLLRFARAGSDKPVLVLDPGTGVLDSVLFLMDVPWRTPEEVK
ncbi:MAG: hypothetical protein J7M26_06635, partial [Armatimonadetes bacterium]|nr:hypothetical protein [Armatimonadota bacterium]